MQSKESCVLSMQGVSKCFSGVKALDGVNFNLHRGEIHALLGENGAGKSTLIKVMTGVYERDSGEQTIDGEKVRPANVAHAQRLGISTVYQEVNLLPNLTVAQNIFLGREPKKFGLIFWKKMNAQAKEILGRYHISIDVSQPLANYSVAIQQMIAIARGVDLSAKVLILDEPTASLDQSEVQSLFAVMKRLKEQGIAIVFVTHFLSQVYEICDRITVLRNGKWIAERIIDELPEQKLVSLMLGKELQVEDSDKRRAGKDTTGEPLLKLVGVGVKNRLHPVDLVVHSNEVVGLAGLLGSGRTELCEAIFGVSPVSEGQVFIGNQSATMSNSGQAMTHGLGLCPEDRKRDGIFANMSIRENIVLALQVKRGWWRNLNRKQQQIIADKYIAALGIATPDANKPIGQLSGGNQQKVILARWLATEPIVLLLDEPTRGIDIGAHTEIIKLIRELCAQGMALIVASSELDELVQFSDRVVVMRDRRKVNELSGSDVSQNSIMQSIARGH